MDQNPLMHTPCFAEGDHLGSQLPFTAYFKYCQPLLVMGYGLSCPWGSQPLLEKPHYFLQREEGEIFCLEPVLAERLFYKIDLESYEALMPRSRIKFCAEFLEAVFNGWYDALEWQESYEKIAPDQADLQSLNDLFAGEGKFLTASRAPNGFQFYMTQPLEEPFVESARPSPPTSILPGQIVDFLNEAAALDINIGTLLLTRAETTCDMAAHRAFRLDATMASILLACLVSSTALWASMPRAR